MADTIWITAAPLIATLIVAIGKYKLWSMRTSIDMLFLWDNEEGGEKE